MKHEFIPLCVKEKEIVEPFSFKILLDNTEDKKMAPTILEERSFIEEDNGDYWNEHSFDMDSFPLSQNIQPSNSINSISNDNSNNNQELFDAILKEVKNDDIVKGYMYEKDKYVTFTDEEFEKIKSQKDKNITIDKFWLFIIT